MAYRFMSCNACGIRLRFMRRIERSSIECPLCGNGMELVAKDLIHGESESDSDFAAELRHVPEPEVIPPEVLAARMPSRRLGARQFWLGLATATVVTLSLILQGVLRIS